MILSRSRWNVVSGPGFLAVATSTRSCPANPITPRLTKPRLRFWGMPVTSGTIAASSPRSQKADVRRVFKTGVTARASSPRRIRKDAATTPNASGEKARRRSTTGSATALNKSAGKRVIICVMKSTGFRIGSI